MLPTFIIAGATKAGTTSLYEYLKPHPEVCMALIKEPCFFTRDRRASSYSNGLSWYENLFAHCNVKNARGEASTVYMVREDSAELIFKTLPNITLIFMLRDPTNRMYSQFWSDIKLKGLKPGNFEDLVNANHPLIQELFYNSQYDIHLKRFMNFFPRDQMHIYLFEDMINNTKEFLQTLYKDIGVNPHFLPPNLNKIYNPTRTFRLSVLQKWLWKFGWVVINKDLSPWQLYILKTMRGWVFKLNTKPIQKPPLSKHIRQKLVLNFEETISFVEEQLNRPLPDWRTH